MAHRLAVLRRALASARLRRVEFAFLGFGIAEYGVWVAVLVYAFQRGGTTASALIAAVQLLPAAVVAPMAARLIDVHGAAAALRAGYIAQAAAVGATALLLVGGAPAVTVYGAAVLAASAVTVTRPAQAALLPTLVDTPAQLTAANVVSGWVESVSLLTGPALASLMLALGGAGAALALFAVMLGGSAALVLGLPGQSPVGALVESAPPDGSLTAALHAAPGAAPALGMLGAEYAAIGALDVLEVVLAAHVLGLGAGGAGYLAATFGVGALVGAAAGVALVGRRQLARPLLLSAAAWGAAFIALGAWPAIGLAFCLLAVAGATRAVLDVGGRTILHRTVPAELHGRVFGIVEGVQMLALAAGSLSVPLVVTIVGPRGAIVVFGFLLILIPLLAAPALRTIERAVPELEVELSVLRGFPLFEMLGPPVLEDLARAMVRVEAPAGETIMREGQRGDQFFLVAVGGLEVSIRGSHVQTIGPGGGFGEIALLRDGIRTATVTTTSPVTLYALGRAPFLEAVTGSRRAHHAARELVAQRLAALPTDESSSALTRPTPPPDRRELGQARTGCRLHTADPTGEARRANDAEARAPDPA